MKKYVFGIDVGGTSVKMGLLTVEGELIDKWEIKTRTENGGENILPDIADSMREKMQQKNITQDDVLGVGIGVPGPVDGNGNVHGAVNLNWGEFNVSGTLSMLTGIKAVAGNDANVAALGEMWQGGGKGFKSQVMVTLGTGVGGGIIIDGKIVAGANGAGGEIGHMHVEDREEKTCGCGNQGCFEQYTSATGITRIGERHFAYYKGETCLKSGDINAKTIFDGYKAGDALCKEIVAEFGEYFGKGLAIIASTLNPEAFVVGGGVSKAGQCVIDAAMPSFDKYVFPGAKNCKFLLATLGNDAGMYGAAKLVIE